MTNRSPEKMPVPGFDVEKPGPHTLIQDGGRSGAHRLGLTSAGPMDRLTFDWANRLCGNPAGTTALEITFGGLSLRANAATRVVVCGPPVDITLNSNPVNSWQAVNVSPGDKLHIGHVRQGCRLYLAVRGGLQVKPVFGSAATAVREGLGGIEGRALQRGDFLPYLAPQADFNPLSDAFCLHPHLRPDYPALNESIQKLHVVPYLQARHISRSVKLQFFSQVYVVSKDINRMGYRLSGEPLAFNPQPMLSEGITPGAIQITANGQPIVLMRDHPTIGGYPKIGVLLSTDMNRLAQLQPGAKLRFVPITVNHAQQELRLAKRLYEATCPQAVD